MRLNVEYRSQLSGGEVVRVDCFSKDCFFEVEDSGGVSIIDLNEDAMAYYPPGTLVRVYRESCDG